MLGRLLTLTLLLQDRREKSPTNGLWERQCLSTGSGWLLCLTSVAWRLVSDEQIARDVVDLQDMSRSCRGAARVDQEADWRMESA